MSKEKMMDDELKLVSSGVLLPGWDATMLTMMAFYKGAYGEEGREKVESLVQISIDDPTSPVEAKDAETLYNFIRDNWDSVDPRYIPKP